MTGSGLLGLIGLCTALGGTIVAHRLRRRGKQPTKLHEAGDLPGLSEPAPWAASTAHEPQAAQGPEASPPAPPPEELPQGSSLAVLAIEVNGLALVDERFGEVAGERALREVIRTVRETLRVADSCERWKAGRLVAVLPGLDEETATQIALRLQRAVSSLTLVTHTGDQVRLGIAVGKAAGRAGVSSLDELRDAAQQDLERIAGVPPEEAADPGPGERLRRALPPSPN
jgi:diguanylate cyclase (GGDEF)-like protein